MRSDRPIFRPNAIRRYLDRREEIVLPRLVSPSFLRYLWLLTAALVAATLLAWLTRVPVHATGVAIVVAAGITPELYQSDQEVFVAAFLPAESLSSLRPGQRIFLYTGQANEPLNLVIVVVEEKVLSPDTARKRFGLTPGATAAITSPAAVALAQFTPPTADLPAVAYLGSLYRSEVEIGSQRVIFLLPLFDKLGENFQ